MNEIKKKRYIKKGIAVVLGMITGFGYYFFIGCSTGTCAITGNPYISTIYGGIMFYLIYTVFEKKSEAN